ncbi:SDR family oxidoreductase [Shinella daejeonensis]|uniref:SDR family NAD(P)-dependent oxidoreductase n=1 Tax=Shinella daejeonensis TaxID=659017 RepID=UPI0020C7F5B7|nr:SDR family NAD(P)-dependent oxidoreductase [Shinella daejeonensis]MCP8897459.1 SDR family oxidoreductase [Shinella daejeonensis]
MSELSGRIIVVTGGETGIGRATVLELARAGANVVMGGILADKAEETIAEASGAPGSVSFQQTDVRLVDQVDALVAKANAEYGRIDGLVCNAGIFDGFASGIETSDRLWDQIIDVNLRGTFYACRAALRHMVEQKAGRIVNVASIGGLTGMADGASYTASKHGVIGLTRHLGCYYAKDGITVNAVCPGVITTTLRDNSTRILGEDAPVMAGVGVETDWLPVRVPMARKGVPEDISAMITFLLSERANYITGQCMTVDGGWTAK